MPGGNKNVSEIRTHYDTLNVTPDAAPSVIRAAYKALAQQYHPDKNLDAHDAAGKMQSINAAWEVLSKPDSRKRYDQWLESGMSMRRGPASGAYGGVVRPRTKHPSRRDDTRKQRQDEADENDGTARFLLHALFGAALFYGSIYLISML